MSHVVAIGPCFQEEDLPALKRLCAEQGAIFKEGQKQYKWYGRWANDYSQEDAAYKQDVPVNQYGKCEHAIAFPGSEYEIGITQIDKGLRLVVDNWDDGGLGTHSRNGKAALAVSQGLSEHVLTRQAQAHGFVIGSRKTRTDGKVEITLTPGFQAGGGSASAGKLF